MKSKLYFSILNLIPLTTILTPLCNTTFLPTRILHSQSHIVTVECILNPLPPFIPLNFNINNRKKLCILEKNREITIENTDNISLTSIANFHLLIYFLTNRFHTINRYWINRYLKHFENSQIHHIKYHIVYTFLYMHQQYKLI